MNIVLIGMPTAGKSTVGVILAKMLGYQFIDTDLVIQQEEKKLLKDIIEEQGIEGFLEVENRINANIDTDCAVIATGGSAIYGTEAMQHLRKIGLVVYIRLSYGTIMNRLNNAKQRGVVLKNHQTLKDLYEERCPLYEGYAHYVVDAENMDIEGLVNYIYNWINTQNS